MEGLGDTNILAAAGEAFVMLMSFERMFFLLVGVMCGLAIGILPGIGGLTGFALLVPFTYTMDPLAAMAMLLGMSAVTSTSDTLPAVLLGVPGTASAQATVLDGHAMAKKGEASRALTASYTASLLGGLFGAFVLMLIIPMVRPLVLAIGTPELLAITAFGIAMVASLSGNAPLRGVIVACIGIMVGMIGMDMQTATMRWTGDVLYLWDGVPMMPVMLGMFALPELCDLAIQRKALTQKVKFKATEGMIVGIKDALRSWFLIIRCSGMGVFFGATPGISGSVVDWLAYGHAIRSEKGASKTFGTGDVRGVIAPGAATNALDGGSLVPTLAFGLPASASMAIFLSAMLVHGIVPGRDMLTTNLPLTYSFAWSIALANIFATVICIGLSVQLARIATLRYTLLLPAVMVVVYIGAYQGSANWGDLYALMVFGTLGWIMKRLKWPRPPLILGFVLGAFIERYMGISIMLYGMTWLLRPGVILLLALSMLILLRPLFTEIRHGGFKALVPRGRPSLRLSDLAYLFVIAVAAYGLSEAVKWPFAARIGPVIVATIIISFSIVSVVFLAFARGAMVDSSYRGIYMDIASEDSELKSRTILRRAAQFFGWFVAFMVSMALIGLIPSVPLLVIAYMRIEGRESWRVCLTYAAALTAFVYVIFDQLIHVHWPTTIIRHYMPALAAIVPSM